MEKKPNAAQNPELSPATLAVHGGEPQVRGSRSITMPIVMSSTYPFADTAELVRYMEGSFERTPEYGRYGNPTVSAAEAKLAALEHGDGAVLMGSGMAAITTTLLAMLKQGQHAIFTSDVYRRTRQVALQLLTKFGVEVDLVEPRVDAIAARVRDNTRLIFTESPTNPYLRVVDLAPLVALAKARRLKTIIDATFATPINLLALNHGVDLVIHSTTKYLAGHNDVLGGVVVGRGPLVEAIPGTTWGHRLGERPAHGVLHLAGAENLGCSRRPTKHQCDASCQPAKRASQSCPCLVSGTRNPPRSRDRGQVHDRLRRSGGIRNRGWRPSCHSLGRWYGARQVGTQPWRR